MRISDWSSDVCSSDLLRDRPVTIETLSAVSLDKLPAAEAATWLDRELVTDSPTPLRDAGFGREVSAAQAVRRQWLVAEQLAEEQGGRVVYRPGMLADRKSVVEGKSVAVRGGLGGVRIIKKKITI